MINNIFKTICFSTLLLMVVFMFANELKISAFKPDAALAQVAPAVPESVSAQVFSGETGLASTQVVPASPVIIDTDGDGYGDAEEIAAGFSPFNPLPVKAVDSDVDSDGLSDYHEILFGTDSFQADTDGDGFSDFMEIDNGFDPLAAGPKKLPIKIEIRLKEQRLDFYVGGYKWREFLVSTGKPSMPTPTGEFTVVNKVKKAWSKAYGLWMPYWLGLDRGRIGIHELPVWPGGYREGEDHLGRPVSHGCIRLGVGPAKYLFERVDLGAKVLIKP